MATVVIFRAKSLSMSRPRSLGKFRLLSFQHFMKSQVFLSPPVVQTKPATSQVTAQPSRTRRSLSALPTTETELSDIAAAATTGLSSMPDNG
jgi:hypothetical protein